MDNKLDQYFGINAQSMLLRSKRAELLASNIANVDTPNFKAKDIDFDTALKSVAEAGSGNAGTLKTTSSKHLQINLIANHQAQQLFRVPMHPSLDGNTVDSDLEKTEFSENAVRYQISLNLLSKKVAGLVKTLRGE